MSAARMKAPVRATLLCAVVAGQACAHPAVTSIIEGLSCSDFNDTVVEQTREIRMVVLYTSAAAVGGDIEAEIEQSIVETNVAFSASGIPIRVVLAHMQMVNMVETDYLSMLTSMTNGTAPLDVAHTLRGQHHADVVGIIRTTQGGLAEIMAVPSLAHRDKAFFVVGRVSMGAQFNLAHELGHLIGGVHARGIAPTPAYSYVYPHVCLDCVVDGLRGWHTIMSGPVSNPPFPPTTRIGLFSNPDNLYFGATTGKAIGDPNAADERSAFRETSTLGAAFAYTPVWFATLRAEGPWFEKKVDDAMIANVRVGDFNNDGLSDVFRVDALTNDWSVSYQASQPWRQVWNDPRKIPLSELRLGDFTGDGMTDVMYVDVAAKEWRIWDGTGTDWKLLNNDAALDGVPVTDLALGDMNGDRRMDVFWSNPIAGKWSVAYSGQGPWVGLNSDPSLKFNTSELRLADFDGDSKMDVLRVDAGSQTWLRSKDGTSPWETLNGPDPEMAVDIATLAISDFDGDGKADVLKPTGLTWVVAWSGKGPLQFQKVSCIKIDNMALGDFDGDKSTDVLRSGIRP